MRNQESADKLFSVRGGCRKVKERMLFTDHAYFLCYQTPKAGFQLWRLYTHLFREMKVPTVTCLLQKISNEETEDIPNSL